MKSKNAIPGPPREMSRDGRREWRKLVPALLMSGQAAEIDRGVLIAYCQAYGRWAEAERLIKAQAEGDEQFRGLLSSTTNGNVVQNPLIGVANKALSDMVAAAKELGITPAARVRLSKGDRPPVLAPPGKKELERMAAENAAEGTGWEGLLGPPPDRMN
jgi:P27 family predicted phage terminase small subunit